MTDGRNRKTRTYMKYEAENGGEGRQKSLGAGAEEHVCSVL